MAFKKNLHGKVLLYPLLDKLTFEQHMLFLSDFFYELSYSALAWYSTLIKFQHLFHTTY